jgi:hypothetical protein
VIQRSSPFVSTPISTHIFLFTQLYLRTDVSSLSISLLIDPLSSQPSHSPLPMSLILTSGHLFLHKVHDKVHHSNLCSLRICTCHQLSRHSWCSCFHFKLVPTSTELVNHTHASFSFLSWLYGGLLI